MREAQSSDQARAAVGKSQVWSVFRSEAVFLFAVPAFGYLIAYVHQFGYLNGYGIPSDFVEIGIGELVNGMFTFFVASVGLALLVDQLFDAFVTTSSMVKSFSIFSIFLFGIQVPILTLLPDTWRDSNCASLWVLSDVFLFISIYLAVKFLNKRQIFQKLNSVPLNYFEKIIFLNHKSQNGFAAFSLTVLFLWSFVIGRSHAIEIREVFLIDGEECLVFVDKFSDGFILKPFDQQTGRFFNNFVIRKVVDDKDVKFLQSKAKPKDPEVIQTWLALSSAYLGLGSSAHLPVSLDCP